MDLDQPGGINRVGRAPPVFFGETPLASASKFQQVSLYPIPILLQTPRPPELAQSPPSPSSAGQA
ncbi:hypothetical protein CCACVL1_13879 [Corchorus capsularis]|uniref:Uncharacterized protein n=1 Tax=Corchorus capsularis TaxID=210143 RepID=A0A1R3I9C1_COCAP|nr:hypothetical protein CCACVL1_13879 [Corchorus capsularis]